VTHNPNVGVGRAWSGENCRADDDGNKYGPDDDRSVPAHGRGKLEAAGKFLLDGPASSQLAISPALAVSGDRFRPRGSAENQVSGADSDRADGGHQDEERNICPCCGARMVIVETFQSGCQPRLSLSPAIGFDSS
jgi:hypothetical protein